MKKKFIMKKNMRQMMMTMKFNRIKVSLINLDREEVTLSLPIKNSELRELLIAKNVVEADQSEVKHLDGKLKSVTKTEIRNFIINKPTNIYYLNSYLLFLKEKQVDLPVEQIEITTDSLKEMIADMLQIHRKDMTLEELFSTVNSTSNQEKNRSKNKKPMFSIRQLQIDNKERKRKRLEKTKE